MTNSNHPAYVWVVDVNYKITGDYNGLASAHATLDGALARLDEWFTENGIDLDTAHYDEVRSSTSICNEVDPDLLDGGELDWGINLMEVKN